jgi:hypothetical protein
MFLNTNANIWLNSIQLASSIKVKVTISDVLFKKQAHSIYTFSMHFFIVERGDSDYRIGKISISFHFLFSKIFSIILSL